MKQQLLVVVVAVAMMGGCARSPTSPDAPGRSDCGLFSPQRSSPYVLPFEVGQSFFTARTVEHGNPQRYAIDWLMPVRTPVVAARAGLVIEVEAQWSDDDHTFGHENHVFILHEDGTVGRYHHLTKDSALAVAGARVVQGQRIALSGNSGNSDAPHLHFDVVREACDVPWPAPFNRPCQSTVPMTFRNTSPHPCGIQSLTTYRAEPY
jgi:murein DD-endopeptidase MepM/ murein hydrolase activator NlpD